MSRECVVFERLVDRSVAVMPHELQPWIFRYGAAMPFFNAGRAVRTVSLFENLIRVSVLIRDHLQYEKRDWEKRRNLDRLGGCFLHHHFVGYLVHPA